MHQLSDTSVQAVKSQNMKGSFKQPSSMFEQDALLAYAFVLFWLFYITCIRFRVVAYIKTFWALGFFKKRFSSGFLHFVSLLSGEYGYPFLHFVISIEWRVWILFGISWLFCEWWTNQLYIFWVDFFGLWVISLIYSLFFSSTFIPALAWYQR
jgi:hypothetical protein